METFFLRNVSVKKCNGIMTVSESHRMKEELLENISDLFLKYGLRSTSMDDICMHLKISKKTLYQFFSNKDDVVEQVMIHRRKMHCTPEELEEWKRKDSIEIMLAIRDHIIHTFKNRQLTNMFDLKKYHPEVHQRLNEQNQRFVHGFFNEMIDKGIQEGYFRKDLNKEVQTYLFTKQMSLLGEPELLTDIEYPVEVMVSTIMENTIRSFLTKEGLEKLLKIIEKEGK